jgi:hypothetical protein
MLRDFDTMPVRIEKNVLLAWGASKQHFDGVLQLKQVTSPFPNCLYDEIAKFIH